MFDKYKANEITRIYMDKYAHLKIISKLPDTRGGYNGEKIFELKSLLYIY